MLPPAPTLLRVTPDDPRLAACLRAYARFLSATIPAEGLAPIPLPMPDAHCYRPPHGAVLLALGHGQTLGTVSLRRLSPQAGEVKRLFVMPQARGQGLARRLLRAIEDEARALGLARLQLDTNPLLRAALALYRAEGWHDIPPYSAFPAMVWLGKTIQIPPRQATTAPPLALRPSHPDSVMEPTFPPRS